MKNFFILFIISIVFFSCKKDIDIICNDNNVNLNCDKYLLSEMNLNNTSNSVLVIKYNESGQQDQLIKLNSSNQEILIQKDYSYENENLKRIESIRIINTDTHYVKVEFYYNNQNLNFKTVSWRDFMTDDTSSVINHFFDSDLKRDSSIIEYFSLSSSIQAFPTHRRYYWDENGENYYKVEDYTHDSLRNTKLYFYDEAPFAYWVTDGLESSNNVTKIEEYSPLSILTSERNFTIEYNNLGYAIKIERFENNSPNSSTEYDFIYKCFD